MAINNFLDQAGLGYLWTKILAAIESHSVTLPDKLVSYKAAMAITATEKLNADTLGGYSATYFAKSADVSTIQETIRTQASEILKAQQAVSSMGSTVSSLAKNKANSVHATQHAAGGSDPITPESIGAVGYNTAQNLTDTQKMRARGNINAADGTFKTVHLDKIGWYRIATCKFSGSGILSLQHGYGSGGPSSLKFLVTMDEYNPALKCIDTDCFQPQFTNARLVTVAKNLTAIDVYYNIAYDNRPVICFIQTGQNSVAIQEPSYISDSDALPNGETLLLPMEYLNPPMKLGIEYRTTERYLEKPVYVKAVDCGSCPASGYKDVVYEDVGIVLPIRCEGTWSYGGRSTIPFESTNDDQLHIGALGGTIRVKTGGKDFSRYTCTATVYYTKITD